MGNESRRLYLSFVQKGLSKEDAFFAVIDHFNDLHWHDRNRYHERIRRLEGRAAPAAGTSEQPS